MNVIVAACFAALLTAPPPAPVDHDELRADLTQSLHRYGVATDVPSLLRAVSEDPRPSVRMLAADLLPRLKEKGAAAAVMRAALEKDADEQVRAHLGWDLLEIEGDQALPVVHALLLRTQDLDNRIHLAWPLAERGDFAGYADVLKGLESQAPTRVFAAQALGAFMAKCRDCGLTPPPVDEALRWVKIPAMRSSMLFALSRRLDDPRVVAALTVVANEDKDELVRDTAKVFLNQAARENQQGHGDHR
jgi:hypothetical protein